MQTNCIRDDGWDTNWPFFSILLPRSLIYIYTFDFGVIFFSRLIKILDPISLSSILFIVVYLTRLSRGAKNFRKRISFVVGAFV